MDTGITKRVQHGNTTFYLRRSNKGNKIGVKTSLQFFIYSPFNQYKTVRLKKIMDLIEHGDITNITDLTDQTNGFTTICYGREDWFV